MQTQRRTRLGRRGHPDILSNRLSKAACSRWAALRIALAHLLEAGLPVLGLGVVGGRLVQRLRQAGARRVQRPRASHVDRTRRRRRARARQTGPRATRRHFALWTFGTQHASIPRCTSAHSIKVSVHPAPTPTRAGTAATVQRIHIQVWWVVLACDVALWRKRVRKAWCKCICNVRHNTYMEPHTTIRRMLLLYTYHTIRMVRVQWVHVSAERTSTLQQWTNKDKIVK